MTAIHICVNHHLIQSLLYDSVYNVLAFFIYSLSIWGCCIFKHCSLLTI